MQGAAYTHACVLYTTPRRVEVESSHTYRRRTRRTYLRLLHLVLGVHLCDDLVHVGLQDHPSHHHLCQDVVDLRNARHFKVREQVFLFNKGKSEVIELTTTVISIYIYIWTVNLFMLLPQTCAMQSYNISYTVAGHTASIEM